MCAPLPAAQQLRHPQPPAALPAACGASHQSHTAHSRGTTPACDPHSRAAPPPSCPLPPCLATGVGSRGTGRLLRAFWAATRAAAGCGACCTGRSRTGCSPRAASGRGSPTVCCCSRWRSSCRACKANLAVAMDRSEDETGFLPFSMQGVGCSPQQEGMLSQLAKQASEACNAHIQYQRLKSRD